MFGPVLILIAAASTAVYAETAVCEQLIECLAKARSRNEECLSSHVSVSSRDSKHECRNESLHNQLKQLIEQRTAHYETCLRTKAPGAVPIENAKKKAKCDAIMRKRPVKRDLSMDDRKGRRSIKRDKKKGQAAQNSCFREARKIKLHCSQLAKCCNISKQCRDTSAIDQKITEKKIEIKESLRQCRAINTGRKGGKKHKQQQQQQQQQSRRNKMANVTTSKP
ncbi:hypothetical protein Tcan_03841 [Toxocara canis]|uniref:Uncharacterized protein n=2 Tax=Toxocara canis TaxID=6265 RepID=A0A0B2V7M0_TOXCA|nr:hypothetical protein Tcan_03841 [Toxocara canis]VDM41905.1 unnamed protein product [Toxocara canis]